MPPSLTPDEIAKRMEIVAGAFYDEALARARGNHSLKVLVDTNVISLKQYIDLCADAHFKRNESGGDVSAYCVDQRAIGFLTQEQIQRGDKIGTENLQQCVAIIIKGHHRDSGEIRVGFAHLDKLTTESSLRQFIEQFEMGKDTYIEIVGARDQSNHKAVSNSNAGLVLNTIVDYMKVIAVDDRPQVRHEMLRNNGVGPNIIYNPLSDTVVSGLPLRNHRSALGRAASRRVQNISKQAEWRSPEPVERCRELKGVDLANTVPYIFSAKEKYDILRSYDTKIGSHIQDLDSKIAVHNLPGISEYCATQFQPFVSGIKSTLDSCGIN